MFLPVSLCHDSRAGSRFLSSAGKLNSPASNWRANWPENYASNLWLQQRIIPRRWEGGELGYNSEDFWLFGVVLETWFGKSKKMGKWKGWEEPWDAQDSWRRGRDERGQWKIWRRWSGEALSSCWRKAFPLLLVCPPYWFLLPPQFYLCLCIRRAANAPTGGHGPVVPRAAELMKPMVSWGISRTLHWTLWCLIRCKCWSVFPSVDIHNISSPGGSSLPNKGHVHIAAFTSMGALIGSFSSNQLPIFIKCVGI